MINRKNVVPLIFWTFQVIFGLIIALMFSWFVGQAFGGTLTMNGPFLAVYIVIEVVLWGAYWTTSKDNVPEIFLWTALTGFVLGAMAATIYTAIAGFTPEMSFAEVIIRGLKLVMFTTVMGIAPLSALWYAVIGRKSLGSKEFSMPENPPSDPE